jgi:hypothetical protein
MTTEQYSRIVNTLDGVSRRIERIEQRLIWEFPTTRELREQLDTEVNEILSSVDIPGAGIAVFEDE